MHSLKLIVKKSALRESVRNPIFKFIDLHELLFF
jgi:hypothetical protein